MITVYQLEHSPFCIPVTTLLRALGVAFQTVNVTNGDRREVIELTGGAYYQVPVLVDERDDSRRVVIESSAESQDVARYLDEHFAGGRLFPVRLEGLQSLALWHLENEVEGVTFRLSDPFYLDTVESPTERAMIIRHKERKFGRGCVEQWRAQRPALLEAAAHVLAPYEKMLAATPFLLGSEPVYADYLLYGILGNLTYKGSNPIPASLPSLLAWERRLADFRF